MAPPALVNLDSFSDVQFRDIVHRNQSLVAPSANIISKLYSHVSGTTANVSAADVVSVDGSNQGQWDLLLSGTTQRLNANTITTGNTAAWSANSVISVRQASTTIRSANVIVGNLNATTITGNLNATTITGTIQTAAQPNITSVGTLSTLAVTGTASMGNLTVNSGGLSKLDNTLTRSFRRTLVTTVNSSTEICEITCGSTGAFVAELCVVQASTATISKMYRFAVAGNATSTGGNWHRLVPLTSAKASDIIVEIKFSSAVSSVTQLRLVRVNASGANANDIECTLTVFQSGVEQVTITSISAALTGQTPSTTIFQNALIAQVSGNVGIGTDAPTRPLDVVGTINSSAAYQIGGTEVLSGSALGTGVTTSSLTSVGTLGSLTVTNAVNAGTLGGTLTTGAQPNITSIGVLTDLALSGNLNLGVGKGYRIDGIPVLGGSTLGSGVTTSSLTKVGALESLEVVGTSNFRGNVFVGESLTDPDSFVAAGTNHIIDCDKYLSANVMIDGSTIYSGALVGNVNCGGSFTLDVTLNQFINGNNTVSKAYTIPVQKGIVFNGGAWARALPTSATAIGSTLAMNDIDLDIMTPTTSTDLSLAIVRSAATVSVNTAASICVSMKVRYNKFASSALFVREIGAYTGFNPTSSSISRSTLMTSCANDGIGIFCEPKNSPYWFDVDSPTATGASNFRTSLNLDTVKTGNCFLSFGNAWRFFYNNTTQNLEIHQNNNTSDSLWTSFTMTGILAAK